MTHTTDKLWVRVLFVLLCAVLAACGTFFAASFDYSRGMPDAFEESEFAREYVEDCMYYVQGFANWRGLPYASVAQGYGGSSFGCVLLRDGEPVFDTTTSDAVLMPDTSMFYRYEEELIKGSADEYNEALMYGGDVEAPGGGQIVYAYPANAQWDRETMYDLTPEAAGYPSSAAGNDDPSGEAEEFVIIGIEHEYTLQGYLNYPILPYGGLYAEYTFFLLMHALEDWALPLAVLCWVLAAALLFALSRDARRQRETGVGVLTRFPFDVTAVALMIAAALLCWALQALGQYALRRMTRQSYFLLRMTDRVILTFVWTAAAAVLLRSGLARKWRGGGENLLLARLSAAARVLFPIGLGVVFCLIGVSLGFEESVCLAGLALILVGGVFSALLFRQLRRLRRASERLAAGELDSKVGADRFWPGIREQAEALDRVGEGIKAAVDQQLKGERLKTELITNVSHDLKTPITSIVSCVELLDTELMKKSEATPEQTAEYIDMLRRQCRRLQKLTDDLIEASKASSGAIDVQREPTDVRELLNQSVGEFAERLGQKRIDPVLTLPEGPCVMETDGQLLWRVLDNLLGNICKYAQPDTRAYIDLEALPGETVISLKNVSETPLNISAEALMERFVRGDASRSTEGSGLGLSIAQSLTRLLGGELTLIVDGDLFKAVIRFEHREEGG